ncbi:MAG TPA: glycoside hydrolase family 3 N-terminal domain-containing protein [Gemmatimonadales bacterium]|nr:glycoside hydrolase family 3 N-terminal domain-containing protein [Gemmatimonadales bacterium]
MMASASLLLGANLFASTAAGQDSVRVAEALDSARVEHLIDSLPLRDRVAQLIMPWIPGNYAAFDDSAFSVMQGWVDSLHVGGIIVSIGSPLDVASKLNRLQVRSPIALLIGADLESGSTFRLIGGTPFPSNMGVAATGSERDAYEVGRVTALEGRAVGIHITFAPVADVNNNPANPIINTRSFGENPQLVGVLVAAAIRGLQENGMLATAKHFPGHGDTDVDSHISMPVMKGDWSRLSNLELQPFRSAINAGVALVMSAHIAMPGLTGDSTRPATLSPEVLTGVLRDSLHFKGIAVTDALGMGGIVNRYGAGEAAVLALIAGADLLLQPADPKTALDAVTTAVESGRISQERINESVRRILTMKSQLGLLDRRSVQLERVPEVVGRAEFLAVARDIARRSIVLVNDSGSVVDSLRARRRPISLVIYGDENMPTAGTQLAAQLRAEGFPVNTFRLWPASGPESYDSAKAALRKNSVAMFAVSVKATANKGTVAMPEPLAKLIDQTAKKRRTVLASLGSPYIAQQTPHVGSYLLAWNSNAVTEWALAKAIAGGSDITGRLPITLTRSYPLGYGIQRKATRATFGQAASGQP